MDRYEQLANKIRDEVIDSMDYNKGLKLSNQYLRLLNKERNRIAFKDNFCQVYYFLGMINKKINNYNESIKYIIRSIEYTEKDQYDVRYINNLMLLSNCYVALDIKNEAIKLYEKCIELYGLINLNRYKIATKFNICRLNNDIKGMKQNINLYKEFLEDNYEETYNDKKQKIDMLKQMETELSSTENQLRYAI